MSWVLEHKEDDIIIVEVDIIKSYGQGQGANYNFLMEASNGKTYDSSGVFSSLEETAKRINS